ncbi:hypothetical protein LCGC14_3110030 [marine sediment metagenome]|uniref:Uncharacterized protein n=1 Tax=marine sediment metagenome TaxID=412755 RepID=A0A0F8WU82_9ZZZZ
MSLLDGAELEEFKPKMSEEVRYQFAALSWTFPETSHITMDVALAKAFADVIDIIVNGGFDTVDSYVEQRDEHLNPQP